MLQNVLISVGYTTYTNAAHPGGKDIAYLNRSENTVKFTKSVWHVTLFHHKEGLKLPASPETFVNLSVLNKTFCLQRNNSSLLLN